MRRLIDVLLAALTCSMVITVMAPAPASQAAPGGNCDWNSFLGECTSSGGGVDDGKSLGGKDSGDAKVPGRACYRHSKSIPCKGVFGGWWSEKYDCYIQKLPADKVKSTIKALKALGREVPSGSIPVQCRPPESGPVWGGPGGGIHLDRIILIPASDAVQPPDPRQMAWKILASMKVRAGQIGIVPESGAGKLGLIGLPTWMWVEDPGPQTTGPIKRSASTRGYTVSVEASLDRVEYDMGDGTTVTCAGSRAAGTPYHDSYGTRDSPTCGHRYQHVGAYTVTARSYWVVNWYGIGQAGTINIDFQRSTRIEVGEAQVITR